MVGSERAVARQTRECAWNGLSVVTTVEEARQAWERAEESGEGFDAAILDLKELAEGGIKLGQEMRTAGSGTEPGDMTLLAVTPENPYKFEPDPSGPGAGPPAGHSRPARNAATLRTPCAG